MPIVLIVLVLDSVAEGVGRNFTLLDQNIYLASVAALLAACRFKLCIASLLAGAAGLGLVFGAVGWIAG